MFRTGLPEQVQEEKVRKLLKNSCNVCAKMKSFREVLQTESVRFSERSASGF